MINNIRPNYINPLTMMKNGRQAKHLSLNNAGEKKSKALEVEKQSIQNSLLLMKGTSGNGETSEETIKLLEKKLDEINNEIKINRQETINNVPVNEKQEKEKSIMYRALDTFRQKEVEESVGCYRVVNDDKGYKIEFVKQTPNMQTVELKPECALVTDRLELSLEGIAQRDTLNTPEHLSIKKPRERTIGVETIISARNNIDRTLEKADSLHLSYGERLEFIREEQKKWVNDIQKNDPEMFVEWIVLHQNDIENGRPDLAGLPADFSIEDFYSHVKGRR